MYDNIEKRNILSTPQNMLNTLNTFNSSFVSPTPETTSYTTLQNLHHEMETNKKNPQEKSTNDKKIFNSYKYYLKPKINSQKFFHKRIKTEDMNRGEKKFRFFKFMKENDNNNNNTSNFIRPFYITQNDFTVKNCEHKLSNSVEKAISSKINSNNNVCKCPYCNHLFYN